MKVGDLVRWSNSDWIGVVIREIPGTAENKVVMWNKNITRQTLEKKYLTVVSVGVTSELG